jgi:geranylgeranyl diphosphate synthase type I
VSYADLNRQFLPAIEAEMRAVVDALDGAQALETFAGMLRYHLGWVDEQLRPATFDMGKRIRPALVLLACQSCGAPWERALPAGAAVELIHNFSLIHDDIEDNSPLRRGRPTVWRLWSMPQALNAGDTMFALAHVALYRLHARGVPPATVLAAAEALDQTCLELTRGQYLDMDFERRAHVSVDDYLSMIAGKTAALTACAARLGALAAGAAPERVGHFERYGRNLGLAFQVFDDVLGIWGDSQVTGKSAATDVESRKKSLPVLYALDRDAELRALYAGADVRAETTAAIVARMTATGARDFALARARHYSDLAIEHLHAAQPSGGAADPAAGEAAVALEELTEWLLQRRH